MISGVDPAHRRRLAHLESGVLRLAAGRCENIPLRDGSRSGSFIDDAEVKYESPMTFSHLNKAHLSESLSQMGHNARDASELLKAMAHESRLLIPCILAEGEKSVGDLEMLLAQRQSTVSQQLAWLRVDGLVESRRDGKSIYYSLANEDLRLILDAVYLVFRQNRRLPRRAEGNAAG